MKKQQIQGPPIASMKKKMHFLLPLVEVYIHIADKISDELKYRTSLMLRFLIHTRTVKCCQKSP